MYKLNIGGAAIPNEQDCPWCSGTMERRGETRMGSGVNSFSMWCDTCGAVQLNAKCDGKKIKGLEYKCQFEDD